MPRRRIPTSLEECFDVLRAILPPGEVERIKAMTDEELARSRFDLGVQVRNAWGMWGDGPLVQDLRSRGCVRSDERSPFIIAAFREHLNGRPLPSRRPEPPPDGEATA